MRRERPSENSFSEFIEHLLKSHHCRDGQCPVNADHPAVLAERFDPQCDETGGWSHRNLYGPIGWAGEYLTHLAIPEICLHGGAGLLTTAMDGNTPQGEAEIKTATACPHTNGETRYTFTMRPTQRREHALPLICVAMGPHFLQAFAGKPLILPICFKQIAAHVDSIFLVPLAAYPTPRHTFILPGTPSRDPAIRALQLLFRVSYQQLHTLGLDGLSRIRAIIDHPEKVIRALRYIEALGTALSSAELFAYQVDPYRLLADAEGFADRIPLNDRVEEALARQTIRRREKLRASEHEKAEREASRLEKKRQEKEEQAIRGDLAFAFLGVLTVAAGRPISALEMRHAYGLRRDTYFPKGFNREARDRGIAVCVEGERRRVRTGTGTRERRLTLAERRDMARRMDEWIRLIRSHADHPFAEAVLDRWTNRAVGDPIARAALERIGPLPPPTLPRQLRIFP